MKDFHERWKQRIEERRSKGANWRSLLIKIAILIVIVYVVSRLSTDRSIDWSWMNQKPAADTLQNGGKP